MDPASPPILIPRQDGLAVAEAGKIGHLFVLDAESGRLLVRSAPLVPQANLFAPLKEERTVIAPGANGGVSWSPSAWSPVTGLVYVVALHQPMWFQLEHLPLQRGLPWYGGVSGRVEPSQEFGTISAVDPASGRIVWRVRTERPMVGGVLATAGGLIFTGEGDGWFRAYDATTGARLWQYRCEAGVNAPADHLRARRGADDRGRRRRQYPAGFPPGRPDPGLRAPNRRQPVSRARLRIG